MRSGVYRIVEQPSGRLYIGSSKNVPKRLRQHLIDLRRGAHRNRFLQRAWDKYGAESFVFEMVEHVEESRLLEREQFWIDSTDCHTSRGGFNIVPTAGSTTGVKRTPEQRERRRQIAKAQMADPAMRALLAERNTGKKLPETQKAKIRASLAGRKVHENSLKALAEAAKSRVITPECRAKMATAKRGCSLSPEHREKIRASVTATLARKREQAGSGRDS